MSELVWRSALDLAAGIASGDVTAVEVTEAHLARIEADPGQLGALLHVDVEGARSSAASVDEARGRGEPLGPLAGVPIAVKDNICTRGIPTTCASRILEGYRPPYDAQVVERLRAAGAVIVAKANLDEFAMGSSTENSAFGAVKNPWDPTKVPGGSSGGSAAAVAAGLAPLSLGSDTGGSVRQPGAFCGVTAFKPTYGRVSRYGLIAFASSLDQVGPLARTVRDAAALLSVIAGPDGRDATCSPRPTADYAAACDAAPEGLRVGVLRDPLGDGVDPEVKEAVDEAAAALAARGCELVDVQLPHAQHSVSVYYLIATAEASSNLARFDGVRYGLRADAPNLVETYEQTRGQGFGPEVKRRIMLGTYALSAGYYDAFYLKAQRVRTLVRRDYDQAFSACDVVLGPTTPTPAFGLGDKIQDPLAMYLADIFTLPASLAGLPAVSTPCGLSQSGLPIGVQLVAPAFEEARLATLAAAVEASVGLGDRHAPI